MTAQREAKQNRKIKETSGLTGDKDTKRLVDSVSMILVNEKSHRRLATTQKQKKKTKNSEQMEGVFTIPNC